MSVSINAAQRERRSRSVSTAVHSFRQIVRALRVAAAETQAQGGLTAAQLFVLRCLSDDAVLSINQLAERTFTDRSSVSSVVDRLVEKGLVERSRAADDRRRAAISLTSSGRLLLRRAGPPPTARLIEGLERLDDDELYDLTHGLLRLLEEMGLRDAPAPMLFED